MHKKTLEKIEVEFNPQTVTLTTMATQDKGRSQTKHKKHNTES